jgi:DNA end-binding protein Ku
VAPDKLAQKPYALLVRAMEQEGKVAIARFVMRTKQYLAALRAKDGVLMLSSMVYADEVNDPYELPELDGATDAEVDERELRMAAQLIDSLTEPWQPDRYEDTYRNRVLELIERKAAGEEVVTPPAAATQERVVDLMAALEASVAEAKESRKRHPTARQPAGVGTGADGAKPAKQQPPKATKRKSA